LASGDGDGDGVVEGSLGDADDGDAVVEGVVEVCAEAGEVGGGEVDVAVDDEEGGRGRWGDGEMGELQVVSCQFSVGEGRTSNVQHRTFNIQRIRGGEGFGRAGQARRQKGD
jgi:hypothetical protein